MKFKNGFCLLFFLLLFNIVSAQGKYGTVTPEDFDLRKLNVDTTKGAIIISDIGSNSFGGGSKAWYTLVFKRECRIMIIDKTAINVATLEFMVPRTGDRSRDDNAFEKLHASTYNLVDGKVVETKLDSKDIFDDKRDKNFVKRKVTLPAVREGSIIEFSFAINSDYYNLQPWSFQHEYPTLWSEFKLDLPDFFEYLILKQGYLPYDIYEHPSHNEYFTSMMDATVTKYRWVIKNSPALTDEKYVTTSSNHVARLEFQLSATKVNGRYRNVMGSWGAAAQRLLNSEDFGADLAKNNGWLDDAIKEATKGSSTQLEKAQNIYAYLQKNIKSNDDFGIWLSQPLKTVLKSKTGSVADINLLMIAMFKYAGLDADPVILSTKKHGVINDIYPILNKFNYVIAKLSIENKDYYLDASNQFLAFNFLPLFCYNGPAKLITLIPQTVFLNADDLNESKVTNVILFSDDKTPGKWEGNVKTTLGRNESADARTRIEKEKDKFEKTLKETELNISDIKYDDLENKQEPLVINYSIKFGDADESDIIYFEPMIKFGYTENPFKSEERKYPVEMPYKLDESYYLNVDIPKGYEVDELPKSIKIMFNETEGYFEYFVSKSGDAINMLSRLKLDKATFSPEYYDALRKFYSLVVKKESEQIVFKKKK